MKAEEAKKIADQALQNLTDALKNGKSERITQYLAMLARFHRYSFGNVLLILSQNPNATHVAGFGTWKQMGRFVKKGEKGIVIIAPMSIRPKNDKPEGEEQVEDAPPEGETEGFTHGHRSTPGGRRSAPRPRRARLPRAVQCPTIR